MSQMPPPPPINPQPPMSYSMAPQTKTSVMAIVSLVSGLLGCFVVTGVIAVITGILGIAQTARPNVKGRGMAIAGILLGLIFSGITIAVGGGMYWGWGKFEEAVASTAQPMVQSVISGDIESAQTHTVLTEEELIGLRQQMSGWGDVASMKMTGFDTSSTTSAGTATVLTGTATFKGAGTKNFEIVLKDGKIAGIHFK